MEHPPGPITIRPLLSSDYRAVAFAFAHLSAQSRYQRYFSPKEELTPRELARLMSVDHWHHEAVIAFSPPPRAPIGIARYVRLDDFEAAEVAIEVVDDWQHRGVGTALMAGISERARAAGIRRFHVSMLRGNRAARALARKLGPPTHPRRPAAGLAAAGNVVEVSYSLSEGLSLPVGSSAAGASSPLSPSPSAPTATGVGFGAGSITVSLTSFSPSPSPVPSPSGVSTITVEPEGTCARRTKSASGSSM
jgi:RimJ/RimL family protein N-acetyltransferase